MWTITIINATLVEWDRFLGYGFFDVNDCFTLQIQYDDVVEFGAIVTPFMQVCNNELAVVA